MENLRTQLEAFKQANEALLTLGKELLPQLNGLNASNMVRKPLMLQMILEKQMELIEEKLLPALPKAIEVEQRNDDDKGVGGKSCRSQMVDDFRKVVKRREQATQASNDPLDDHFNQILKSTSYIMRGTGERFCFGS